MKTFYTGVLLCIASIYTLAAPANNNQFGMMPHKRIMELNIESCISDALALGDSDEGKECIEYQNEAFKQINEIYNKYPVANASWSLCIGQSKTGYTYDYLVLLACMKTVKSICKENQDRTWVNPRQCTNGIESGLWINNPKIYEPLDKIFTEN